MRYLVQHSTIAGKHTDDFATEAEAVRLHDTLKAAKTRDVEWWVSMNWEAA